MTIIEAIKSGKAFKRINEDSYSWLVVAEPYLGIVRFGQDDFSFNNWIVFSVENIIADDWIVREE